MSPRRPRTDSPRASKAQQEWNQGLTGPTPARPAIPLTATCPTADCGAPKPPPPADEHGWVFTKVAGSADPGRWWCSGSCATYGIARAELRLGEPWPST
ncbi:hypothetical protein [Kitasatospora cineracea]|uniref:hypothetical protein n=1 Tax=Kitasatospora cineracea TaxID=88074 RepID=UPI00368B95BC